MCLGAACPLADFVELAWNNAGALGAFWGHPR